jgi:hypothetical protein
MLRCKSELIAHSREVAGLALVAPPSYRWTGYFGPQDKDIRYLSS